MRLLIHICLLTALCVFSLCGPEAASAQNTGKKALNVDILALTCEQFAEFEPEETPLILAWLDGWTAAQTGRETIPPEWLGDLAVLVNGYCRAHPKEPVYKALQPVQ